MAGLCEVGCTHRRSRSRLCLSRSCSMRLLASPRDRVCCGGGAAALEGLSSVVAAFGRESRDVKTSSIF